MRRRFRAAAATAVAAAATAVAIGIMGAASEPLRAQANNSCAGLPTHADLQQKLYDASFSTSYTGTNRGFGNNMWATIVNRDGIVCAVAFTVQPGGSLFGLQDSNPVNTLVAYAGPASQFGQANDPMKGERLGGITCSAGGWRCTTRTAVSSVVWA